MTVRGSQRLESLGGYAFAEVDRIVDDYEPVIQAVEVDIQEVEHDMFSPDRTNPAERIYEMQREVLGLHRAAAAVKLRAGCGRGSRRSTAPVTPRSPPADRRRRRLRR